MRRVEYVHDDWNEDRRTISLEHDICEGFEESVRDEEDGESSVVMGVIKLKIGGHVVNFCISNICSIKEGQEV